MRNPSFDTLTNVALLVTCCLLSTFLAQNFWHQPRQGESQRPFVEGDAFPIIQGLDYGNTGRTVVLFVSSSCKYCTASMSFYSQLSKHRNGKNFRIVVTGFEGEEVISKYVTAHGLHPDSVSTVDPNRFRFRGTPTLAVVDASGRLVKQWAGILNASEQDVLKLLGLALS